VVTVISLLQLVGGNVPERLQQASRVVPRDPVQRGELAVLDAFPRPLAVDLFGLVEAADGLRERVIVRIPGAADRRLDPRRGQALGVPDREILPEFNRSSQHHTERGCDDDTKKAFGTGGASETTIARPALSSAA
jgi:hypothetical protein